MKDFVIFDKVLKLNWVRRLCSNHDAPWRYIPPFYSTSIMTDCKLLCLSEYLPASFYKDFISFWQKIAANSPKSNVEVLNQII